MCIKTNGCFCYLLLSYSCVSNKRSPSDSLKVFRGNAGMRGRVKTRPDVPGWMSKSRCTSLPQAQWHKATLTKLQRVYYQPLLMLLLLLLYSSESERANNGQRTNAELRRLAFLGLLFLLSRLVLVLSASESCCLWSEVFESEWRVASLRCLINPSTLRGSRAPVNETARGGERVCERVCARALDTQKDEVKRRRAHRRAQNRKERLHGAFSH